MNKHNIQRHSLLEYMFCDLADQLYKSTVNKT